MSQRRKLAAVVSCDLEGFAARMRSDEAEALKDLKVYQEYLAVSSVRHGSAVFKTRGDETLVLFHSALDATAFAREVQENLRKHNEASSGERALGVRMGIHLGDVVLDNDDVLGESVLFAGALRRAAAPGRIATSRQVYDALKGRAQDLFRSAGLKPLPGFDEPAEVFQDAAPEPGREAGPDGSPFDLKPAPETARRAVEPLPEGPAPADADAVPGEEAGDEPAPAPGPVTEAVLLVGHPGLMLKRFGGVTVLERQLFELARAGVRKVWIAAHKPPPHRLAKRRFPAGLEILWGSWHEDHPKACRPPYANVSGDHLFRQDALRRVLSTTHERGTTYQAGGQGLIQVFPTRRDKVTGFAKVPFPAGAALLLESPLKRGYPWLLDGARRDDDGLLARRVGRRISLAVTRILLRLPLRPNHVTGLAVVLGLTGALKLAGGAPGDMIAGALLLGLYAILDGCDGELARLRFQESDLGAALDRLGGGLVRLAFLLCLGIGLWRLRA